MLTSRITAALCGALTIGAVYATAPAMAAPVATGPAPLAQAADAGLVQQVWHRGYAHGRYYGPPRYYGRPVYRPRCVYVDRRVWNGYRWVIRPVRVCR